MAVLLTLRHPALAQLTAGGDATEPVAGVVHDPWDAFWGQRYAVICDPDGNTVDLFAALG